MENYYSILNVQPNASIDEIRKAFRREAKKCHPDLYHNKSQEEKQKYQKQFVLLTKAYDTLKEEDKRKAYDRLLQKQSARPKKPKPERKSSTYYRSTQSTYTYDDTDWETFRRQYYQEKSDPLNEDPEETWKDLLRDVEDLLGQVGMPFKDPVDILVQWAVKVFKEVAEIFGDEPQTSQRTRPRPEFSYTSSSYQESILHEIEEELQKLKREAKSGARRRTNSRSTKSATPSGNSNKEIETELDRLKKRYGKPR